MPVADSSRPDDAPEYLSPKRTLAHCFRLSRDRWKAKATHRREELRAMKVRLRDVEASRELWKTKALHLQEQLHHLSAAATEPLPQDPAGGCDLAGDRSAQPTLPEPAAAPLPLPADLDPTPPAPPQAAVAPTVASAEEPFKKKRRR
jgi:hypothetical protein